MKIFFKEIEYQGVTWFNWIKIGSSDRLLWTW